MLDWSLLLNSARFGTLLRPAPETPGLPKPDSLLDTRTEIERDFDRILFSTPVRRLGDKTQVFPLEKIESVRTRLTHSHEVANLRRSIGTYLAYNKLAHLDGLQVKRNVPSILAAIGLGHDIGNPPFGHQVEEAIRSWVKRRELDLFYKSGLENTRLSDRFNSEAAQDLEGFPPNLKADFLNFEGNAQTVPIMTRLQVVEDDLGLNLCFGTLARIIHETCLT
jgi:dGTPase